MECRICHNTEANSEFQARENMFGLDDSFPYFECGGCGCLQIVEMPLDMSRYYPESYYSFDAAQPFTSEPALKKIARKLYSFTVQADISGRVFKQFPPKSLREPMTIIDLNRFSRILDVGSGSGLFLYSLRENGMKNLLGIDKYIAGDINYEKGLTVKKLPLGQVDGPWDLIMFHHSFEHDFQPEQTLVDVAALLADGGLCWIRMPMVPSYAWLHYRTDWINLDAPRHLYIHSIESMRVLSEKAGLELCHVVYDSTEGQFLGSEQAARGIPLRSKESYAENPAASIFTQDDINRYRRQAEELNLKGEGDSAAIFLRKNGTENS